MFKVVFVALAAALLACGPLPKSSLRYSSELARVEYESSIRLVILCDGEIGGYGSGVAVSDHQVLTARHVAEACSDLGVETTFLAYDAHDRATPMHVEKLPQAKVDAARLAADDELSSPFDTWAHVSLNVPSRGDNVCMVGGQMPDERVRKCGEVWSLRQSRAGLEMLITLSPPAVPGNSGSPIYDEQGNVIGILWGATFTPVGDYRERYAVAWTTLSFAELVP